MHGHMAVTEMLLELNPMLVDARDSCNTSPLMDACRFGFLDLMELLILKYKADISLENSLGMKCLHIAAQAGQLAVITSLVRNHSMEVNMATRLGHTPLHYAIRVRNLLVPVHALKCTRKIVCL